jgi:hypothetical protein
LGYLPRLLGSQVGFEVKPGAGIGGNVRAAYGGASGTGWLARDMTAGMAKRLAGRFQIHGHGEIKHKIMQNHERGRKTSKIISEQE